MGEFIKHIKEKYWPLINGYLTKVIQLDIGKVKWNDQFFSFSQFLKTYYFFLCFLTLIATISLIAIFLKPSSSASKVSSKHSVYHFNLSEDQRQKIWVSLASGPRESRDPLWLKLCSHLIYKGINARPDNASGPNVIFEWIKSQNNLLISPQQTHYFLCKSNEVVVQEGMEGANLGVTILEILSSEVQPKTHIELTKPDLKGVWKTTESFWLQKNDKKKPAQKSQNSILTALQKSQCRWFGPDLFLLNHSDPQNVKQMQRLEIISHGKQKVYYIGPEDGLIQKDKEWTVHHLGEKTRRYPLFIVEKFDEEKLSLLAWSSDGMTCYPVNINKQQEVWRPYELQDQLRLINARSKDQVLMQIGNQRWNLKIFDWMMHSQQGWQKITSSQVVDQYVAGQIQAELLIFKDLKIDPQGQVTAYFTLYSPYRSQIHHFELSSSFNAPPSSTLQPMQSIEMQRDPNAKFVPMPRSEDEKLKWPAEQERAWQPPQEISPQTMLDILKAIYDESEQLDKQEI
jgi:hypothetical protein